MRVAAIECPHADAGHRNFDFLKITTDDGLVGWSEHNESLRRRQAPGERKEWLTQLKPRPTSSRNTRSTD